MILILFFTLFIFLKSEETEAMKAMDKKLFRAQLEKDLRNLENNTFKNKIPEEKKENPGKPKETTKKELPPLKKENKILPKVNFKYNQKEYNKFLDDLIKIYKLKVTNKGNIIIGSRIKNLNLLDKLYGNSNFFYYPLKKTKYNFNKKIEYYFIKKIGLFIKLFDINNLLIKEEKGEIFDIFVEEFQEELY